MSGELVTAVTKVKEVTTVINEVTSMSVHVEVISRIEDRSSWNCLNAG